MLSASPVFDPVLGFGGIGQGTAKCVQDGPFKNFTINIGLEFTSQSRCVYCHISNAFGGSYSAAAVQKVTSPNTYEEV